MNTEGTNKNESTGLLDFWLAIRRADRCFAVVNGNDVEAVGEGTGSE
ncbi:hypothetical protein [Fictibacillus enclensis]|nr:hypothetical protein [Fictibacillus enclensis]